MKPFDNDMVINRIKKAKTAKTGKSTEPRKVNAYEKAISIIIWHQTPKKL